ncbi:MAG: hypothetical protein FWE22_06455 [Firmicutes bacterium]|nr:hypothetical protein [Bacillota bacterium]
MKKSIFKMLLIAILVFVSVLPMVGCNSRQYDLEFSDELRIQIEESYGGRIPFFSRFYGVHSSNAVFFRYPNFPVLSPVTIAGVTFDSDFGGIFVLRNGSFYDAGDIYNRRILRRRRDIRNIHRIHENWTFNNRFSEETGNKIRQSFVDKFVNENHPNFQTAIQRVTIQRCYGTFNNGNVIVMQNTMMLFSRLN